MNVLKQSDPRFLTADISISPAGFNPLIAESIERAVLPAGGLWVENLHLFSGHVKRSPQEVVCTYSIADFPDETGFFSTSASDEKIKNAIIEEFAAAVLGAAVDLCSREYWAKYIRVPRLVRDPEPGASAKRYMEWLQRLHEAA